MRDRVDCRGEATGTLGLVELDIDQPNYSACVCSLTTSENEHVVAEQKFLKYFVFLWGSWPDERRHVKYERGSAEEAGPGRRYSKAIGRPWNPKLLTNTANAPFVARIG